MLTYFQSSPATSAGDLQLICAPSSEALFVVWSISISNFRLRTGTGSR